jgi:hypothetical protein
MKGAVKSQLSFHVIRSQNNTIFAADVICAPEEICGLRHWHPLYLLTPKNSAGWFTDKLGLICKDIIRLLFKNARSSWVMEY